jgi:hypothetical protein
MTPSVTPATRTARARIIAVPLLVVGLVASIVLLFTRSDEIWIGLAFTTFLVVGFVLATKRPSQPIGWLFISGSVIYLIGDVAGSLVEDPGFPEWPGSLLAGTALWVKSWYFPPALVLLVPLPSLLFPTGKLPTHRWRVVAVMAITGAALAAIPRALAGVMCVDYDSFDGCLRLSAKPLGVGEWYGEDSAVSGLGALLLGLGSVLALISVVLRYRRSRGVERAQMKWFMLGVTATVVAMLSMALVDAFALRPPVDVSVLYSLGIAAIPVTVGVAILRYHLYDIDRIVSRTITYVIVLVVLSVVFVGIVGLPLLVLGSGEAPSWLVAVSTLVVFSLFTPVRRQVQRVVDRRFHRLPYDADRVVSELEAHLRDAVEPEAIVRAWADTANAALQPTLAGSWVRSAP